QLSELPNLSVISTISIYCENNQFTFEDIEPNIGISDFFYSPQDSVGNELTLNLTTGATFNLSVAQVGGTANQYQWKRNGMTISGATNNTYHVGSVAITDEGDYICEITNTIATALTLYSRPFHVIVDGQTGVEPSSQTAIPKTFALKQNYPNPFNPTTQIEYHLPEAGDVKIIVYNIEGREVCQLVNAKKSAGIYTVHWDGMDGFRQSVASGIYFCRIDVITNSGQQPAFSQVKRMIYMK
ncbi:T9SS type A sorting domain-containing protein, partial [bacterium]